MKSNVSPGLMKWGISLVMTLVYAFGAALFYYLPARGEPNLEVSFEGLLLHFTVLMFLLWIVLIPGRRMGKAPDVLMLTVLTVPAGLVSALLLIFLLGGLGIHETYGVEYFAFSFLPFLLALKTVEGRFSLTPPVLAVVYSLLAYTWRNVLW